MKNGYQLSKQFKRNVLTLLYLIEPNSLKIFLLFSSTPCYSVSTVKLNYGSPLQIQSTNLENPSLPNYKGYQIKR